MRLRQRDLALEQHLAKAANGDAGRGADRHIRVLTRAVERKQIDIAEVVLAILLAFHVTVHEEQTDVPVADRGAALDKHDRIVVNIRLHAVARDAHREIRLRICRNGIILIVVPQSRRGIAGCSRRHIQRDDLILLRLLLGGLQARTLSIQQLHGHKATVVIQTAQLPERLPLLGRRLVRAAGAAKCFQRDVHRIADAQKQFKIDLHIVTPDDAIERLRGHLDLPRELIDLDLAFIQQFFERGSDHAQHPFATSSYRIFCSMSRNKNGTKNYENENFHQNSWKQFTLL